MIDARASLVASTATQWYGHEGDILRYCLFHSLALAALAGILVTFMAYVYPFTPWFSVERSPVERSPETVSGLRILK